MPAGWSARSTLFIHLEGVHGALPRPAGRGCRWSPSQASVLFDLGIRMTEIDFRRPQGHGGLPPCRSPHGDWLASLGHKQDVVDFLAVVASDVIVGCRPPRPRVRRPLMEEGGGDVLALLVPLAIHTDVGWVFRMASTFCPIENLWVLRRHCDAA